MLHYKYNYVTGITDNTIHNNVILYKYNNIITYKHHNIITAPTVSSCQLALNPTKGILCALGSPLVNT